MGWFGFEQHLPEVLTREAFLGLSTYQWAGLAILTLAGLLLGTLIQWGLERARGILEARTINPWDEHWVSVLIGPVRLAVTLLVVHYGCPLFGLDDYTQATLRVLVRSLLIVTLTWLGVRMVRVGARFLEDYLGRTITDPARLRAIHTQVRVPAGLLHGLVLLVGVALVMLQFEPVAGIGLSLLASAGVVGIVVGLAAQRTVANLLASLQIAFTQPIKIGDTVEAEKEIGVVEEINVTYVAVQLWDRSRLIVPLTYFVEKPFRNLSKTTSDLVGAVLMHADYTVPVEEVRAELTRILEATDLWDRRVYALQVTELTPASVELRAIVSAVDNAKLWSLRCHVRERLLAWLQTQGRGHLPVARYVVQDDQRRSEML